MPFAAERLVNRDVIHLFTPSPSVVLMMKIGSSIHARFFLQRGIHDCTEHERIYGSRNAVCGQLIVQFDEFVARRGILPFQVVITGYSGDLVMRHFLTTFWRKEEGASLVEYALLVALIAVVCIGTLIILGGNVNDIFLAISNALGAAAPAP